MPDRVSSVNCRMRFSTLLTTLTSTVNSWPAGTVLGAARACRASMIQKAGVSSSTVLKHSMHTTVMNVKRSVMQDPHTPGKSWKLHTARQIHLKIVLH